MIDSIRKRLVAAVAAAVALGAVGSGAAATQDYTPFVTDFPSPASTTFIPGVTDFGLSPRPSGGSFVIGATAPAKPVGDSGLDWGDVSAGAGMGIAFTVAIAAGALVIARRRGSLGPARAS
jgi:hypothetical protein